MALALVLGFATLITALGLKDALSGPKTVRTAAGYETVG